VEVKRKNIYLIDLPTFPKGQITLAFPVIAATLPKEYNIIYLDLNIEDLKWRIEELENCLFVGMKVSCQNYDIAVDVSNQIKLHCASVNIIWGGEMPTLLPAVAKVHCDSIVTNAFESVAVELILDCEQGVLKKRYNGGLKSGSFIAPDFSIIKQPNLYSRLFGYPLETSKGCDKKCTLCMVHTMQPNLMTKTKHQLEAELSKLDGHFVNVVDYNIGVSETHLNNLLEVFTASNIAGWMGEMCIETLNNEALLSKLAKSKCRIIYCGLESTDEAALGAINKSKTNSIANYEIIVQKAQKHGIQIAAGIIIGLPNSTAKTLSDTFSFFKQLGLIYVKLTFLTYNPGTKVFNSMKRVGKYLTDDITQFDGNHFTFLPEGLDKAAMIEALELNIKDFYASESVERRANTALGNSNQQLLQWFKAVNELYSEVYFKWLNCNVFTDEQAFKALVKSKYTKEGACSRAEVQLTTMLTNAY
jgi:radical SAM superfamily enzyme YgiQ (UPF0313 family)